MSAGEPDVDALRSSFTELEFTSLLKELLPQVGGHARRTTRGSTLPPTWKTLVTFCRARRCARDRRGVARSRSSPDEDEEDTSRKKPQSANRCSLSDASRPRAAPKPQAAAVGHLRRSRAQPPSVELDCRDAHRGEACELLDRSATSQSNSRLQIGDARTARALGIELCRACSTIPCCTPICSIPPTPSHRCRHRLAQLQSQAHWHIAGSGRRDGPARHSLAQTKWNQAGLPSSMKRSICRWCRCWRAWNRPA